MSSLRWLISALAVLAIAASTSWPSRSAARDSLEDGSDAFPAIASVLKSPRCQNCHTATDFPRQGDDRHRHRLNVMRGPSDHGAPGLACATCHASRNNPSSGVPGAPNWGVAPISQQWETLDAVALCHRLRDPATNGGRSLQQLEAHLNADPLVQWAWSPGANAQGHQRSQPPLDQQTFHALVAHWIDRGARCPA